MLDQPLISASAAAQQKSYVTYTVPSSTLEAPSITLLEARSLLASSGTTGLRTWEAALFLGAYLFSSPGRHHILNQEVLELGAGTGFLSILCAKHLGAKRVLATDGSLEVINHLESNFFLNGLAGAELVDTAVLKWGHMLTDGILKDHNRTRSCDLILGADVVGNDLLDIESTTFRFVCLNSDVLFTDLSNQIYRAPSYSCLTKQAIYQYQPCFSDV